MKNENEKLLTSFEKKCPLCKKGKLKERTERVRVDSGDSERFIIFTYCGTCPYAAYRETENESEV